MSVKCFQPPLFRSPSASAKTNLTRSLHELWSPIIPIPEKSLHTSYSHGFRSRPPQNGEVLRLSSGLAGSIEPDRLE